MTDDYHIFVLPEQMKLDLMTSDQRRFYAIQKRMNAPSAIPMMTRVLSDASRERGASVPLAPRLVLR